MVPRRPWLKSVTLLTRGAKWPFRCLDCPLTFYILHWYTPWLFAIFRLCTFFILKFDECCPPIKRNGPILSPWSCWWCWCCCCCCFLLLFFMFFLLLLLLLLGQLKELGQSSPRGQLCGSVAFIVWQCGCVVGSVAGAWQVCSLMLSIRQPFQIHSLGWRGAFFIIPLLSVT